MSKFELYCLNSPTEMTRITPIVGKLEWSDNIDELAMKLQFSIAYNDDRFFPKSPVTPGSKVMLKGAKGVIGEFIVIDEEKSGRGEVTHTAMDYAWYLNKSKETYQFNGISTKQAIEEVCRKVGLKIGKNTIPSTSITKIYFDKAHSDVLKDILEYILQEVGTVCRMRMEGKTISFYTKEEEYIKPVFKFTPVISDEYASLNYMSEVSKRLSIDELRNSIKIIVSDNEKFRVVSETKDQASINKYGLLQEIISIDEVKSGESNKVATNKLKELNRVFEESSFNIPADDKVKTGKFLEVNEPISGLVGKYMIASSNHTYKGGVHTCKVTIKSKATLEAEEAGAIADGILDREVPEESGGGGGISSAANDGTTQGKVWTKLRQNGLSEQATASTMGNIEQESNFRHTVVNSIGAFGLCQWLGGRRRSLQSFAKSRGTTEKDLDTQIDFLIKELNSSQWMTSKSGMSYSQFKSTTNIQKGTEAFCWSFERPGRHEANIPRRVKAANKYYSKYKGSGSSSGSGSVGGKRQALVNYALAQTGKPYSQSSNRETTHFDCSSLVYRSMKAVGLYPKNKSSGSTRTIGKDGYFTKISKSQLQPGDIALNAGSHTAIFIGNNKTMEAKQWGVPAGQSTLGNRFSTYWRIKGIDG